MKIGYKRELNGSYMTVTETEYAYENSELLMLMNNKIPGLLEVQLIINDGLMEYWYDITGSTSFTTLLEISPLNGDRIRRLIEDIFDMNRQLEEYLLDGENILYFPDMIYFERKTEKYRFCYLPGCKTEVQDSLRSLTEMMLTKIDHRDADAVKMGYALYEVSQQEGCSLQELLACIVEVQQAELKEEAAAEMLSASDFCEPADTAVPVTDQNAFTENGFGACGAAESWVPRRRREHTGIQEPKVKKEKKSLFGRNLIKRQSGRERPGTDYRKHFLELQSSSVVTEPFVSDNPTVCLEPEHPVEIGRLIYQGEGREDNFLLEEDLFILGKEEDTVDGLLRADTVSRVHAKIFRQGGCYYIEDLNSTNGTYVNGKEVYYRQPVKLKKQDCIALATEEYLFN